MKIRCAAVLSMVVLGGCAGTVSPSAVASGPAGTDVVSNPTTHATPSIIQATSGGSQAVPDPLGINGKIAFTRFETKIVDGPGSGYTIDPDGTHRRRIGTGDVGCSAWSPDGAKVLCVSWFENEGGRPATASPDGSGFSVLDALPNRKQALGCGEWFPDGGRFLCDSSWDENANPADNGLYTVRASDGGDLSRVTVTPTGCADTHEALSPDERYVVFDRICGKDEVGVLYRVNEEGGKEIRISPPEVQATDAFGGPLSVDWSPDGSELVFSAYVPAADSTALYVVNADGTDPRQIVSTDVGAVSAQWSPDGRWIAFTSRYRSHPQVWVVHPDGTGLAKLTDGADGSNSVAPVWSPDGTKILFARDEDGVIGSDKSGRWSLWIMGADGKASAHLVDVSGLDGYGWGTAPTG
jgi:Tol biopolymer transport system component